MIARIGSSNDGRGSQMAAYARKMGLDLGQPGGRGGAMRASIGAEAARSTDPRELAKLSMARTMGVPQALANVKVGADCGAGGCEQPIDPRVIASIAAAQNGNVTQPPAGAGFTPDQWAAVITAINATKYCPSPARVGWQQDSLTFTTAAPLNSGASATINVTPQNAFCMSALVGAAGTSNDTPFQIDSLTYAGSNYVKVGPWWAPFYTGQAACCLCVRQLPIIDPNTTVSMGVTMQTAAGVTGTPRVQIFGETLFCGGPG